MVDDLAAPDEHITSASVSLASLLKVVTNPRGQVDEEIVTALSEAAVAAHTSLPATSPYTERSPCHQTADVLPRGRLVVGELAGQLRPLGLHSPSDVEVSDARVAGWLLRRCRWL